VRHAIREHLRDFVAVLALVAIAAGIGGYILDHQRFRFPFIDDKPFTIQAELENAQAVTPGQGQTVRVAGVEVGEIGEVHVEDGVAVVDLEMKPGYEHLVRRDATALLRAKTGLKDMFIELDPGEGEPLKEGERIPLSQTATDIDPDEILEALDADARAYLKLLITGAGKGLKGRGGDLAEVFARLGPLHRDLARVEAAVAERRRNLARLVNRWGKLTDELGRHDDELARLVSAGDAALGAFAAQDRDVSAAIAKLPSALQATKTALGDAGRLADDLGPALDAIRPAFEKLDEANEQVGPLVREGEPIIRRDLRPFARAASPFFGDLGPGARNLAKAGPDVEETFLGLNRLFNIGAYNPKGAEPLTGNPQVDRDRQEGYLYWLAWLAQNTVSLFSTSDAQGPWRRITLGGVNCSILTAIGVPKTVTDLMGTLGLCAAV